MDSPKDIQEAFLEFYSGLLGSKMQGRKSVKAKVVNMGPKITQDHKDLLNFQFSKEDVKRVLFSIPNDKAPGADGYGSMFFKKSWNIIGDDLSKAVLSFFNQGKLLKELNATIISLVLKVKILGNVSYYRSISCCNITYKCITKLICERLRKILPDIISNTQGAFVKGRHIIDNVLLCQDLVRCYKPRSNVNGCL